MSHRMPITMVSTLATMALCSPLAAQAPSTVTAAALDAAVAAEIPGNRTALTAALTSDQGLAAASQFGLTADDIATRVAALDDATVRQLSDRILAGGANVVISTTLIIIVLLVIILLTA